MSPLLPVTDKSVFHAQSPPSLGKGLTVTLPSVLCFGA